MCIYIHVDTYVYIYIYIHISYIHILYCSVPARPCLELLQGGRRPRHRQPELRAGVLPGGFEVCFHERPHGASMCAASIHICIYIYAHILEDIVYIYTYLYMYVNMQRHHQIAHKYIYIYTRHVFTYIYVLIVMCVYLHVHRKIFLGFTCCFEGFHGNTGCIGLIWADKGLCRFE